MATTSTAAVKTGTMVDTFNYNGLNFIKLDNDHVMICNYGVMDIIDMVEASVTVKYRKNGKYWKMVGITKKGK